VVSYPPPGGRNSNSVLNRAFAAGAALVVGTVALTGIFVAKIANSYRASHSGGSGTSQGTNEGDSGGGTSGGGQVSVPQQNQAPVGGSYGS
jgi:hypothetical protein